MLIEKLKAAQGGFATFLLDGKAKTPVVHEQAQINAFVEDQSHLAVEVDIAEYAVFFVYRVGVAREGHDETEAFEALDELRPLGLEANCAFAAGSSH